MWQLPAISCVHPPGSAPQGSAQSFVSSWPLRLASHQSSTTSADFSYLCSRVSSLLETMVACKGWQAWLLAETTTPQVAKLLVPDEPAPAHVEPCWLLIWQTRLPSTLVKERNELRRLWETCRWCPANALDFESIFDESVLTEAQKTLRPLDALLCAKMGFHCAERKERESSVESGPEDEEETEHDSVLCLSDISALATEPPVVPTTERGPPSLMQAVAARLLEKRKRLSSLSSFRQCQLEHLDAAHSALDQIEKAASPSFLAEILEHLENASPICELQASGCVHDPYGLDWIPLVYCACGRAAEVECRAACRRPLCSFCIRADYPISAILEAFQSPDGFALAPQRDSRFLKRVSETEAKARRERGDFACTLCFATLTEVSNSAECSKRHLICGACVLNLPSTGCPTCSETGDLRCVICAVASRAPTVSAPKLPLCVKCAVVLHNTQFLMTLRGHKPPVEPSPKATHASAPSEPCRALVSLLPVVRGSSDILSVLATSLSGANPADGQRRGSVAVPVAALNVRSALLPKGCAALTVWSKKLVFPHSRDWLVELTVGNVKSSGVIDVRRRRLQSMETGPLPLGCTSLRLELFDLVIDFAQALRAQNAWYAAETLREAHVYDFCVEALGRLLPTEEVPQWPPIGRFPQQIRRRMADLHASEGICSACGAVVSVEALATQWRQAPAGAGSQIELALGCGHTSRQTTPWQCLNSDCRTRNPFGPGMRTVSLSVQGGRDEEGEQQMQMTRCAGCSYPLCFGRTVFSLRDILRPSLRREIGGDARHVFPSFLSHVEGFGTG